MTDMTPTQNDPTNVFTRRVETIQDIFSPIGTSPAVASQMFDTDTAITKKLQDLDGKVAGPSDEDLTAAGTAYASGKGLSKVTTALQAPEVTGPRYAAIRAAAQRELVRRGDLPEFATAALIDSMRQSVTDYLTATANAAATALEDLPAAAVASIRAGKRASQVDNLIDLRTTATSDIGRLRDTAGVWSTLWEGAGAASTRSAWARMFNTLATGSTSPHGGTQFAQGSTSWWAVWFPAKGIAALAVGYRPETVILNGLAEFAPLSDPFGEDLAVYEHRLRAGGGVESMCAGRTDIMAAALRREEPAMASATALKRSSKRYTLLERVGLSDPARALDEYLKMFPAYSSDNPDVAGATTAVDDSQVPA
ncbi:MAG: hypothetical protein ACTIL2_10180 [Corynebacterium sp.]|uniref:hypothetical protein n=1 Tax=Corynebacterium sp. TaxID=1720 RepID=UPI003F98E2D4